MSNSRNANSAQPEDLHTRLLRKCVRDYQRKVKKLEYARLRSLVPAIATQQRVSKIQVIEEAIKYIAHLQAALATRIEPGQNQSNTIETQEDTRQQHEGRKIVRQKRQRLASYMIKTQRHTLPTRSRFSSPRPKSTNQG